MSERIANMNKYRVHMDNSGSFEIHTEKSINEILGDTWATGVYLWKTRQGDEMAVFKEHIVCIEKVIDRHEE